MVSVADGGGSTKNTTIRHTAGGRYPVLQSKTCVIMQHYASWHSQLDPGLRRDDDLNCTLHFKKTPTFLWVGGYQFAANPNTAERNDASARTRLAQLLAQSYAQLAAEPLV